MSKVCRVGGVAVGGGRTNGSGRPLAVICGPCVLESKELGLSVGRVARDACAKHGMSYIFKASFDKANRSS
ncbi:MAG TPA: hypothetical protein VEB22_08225, partial [Phycisphaerales bacterium]|nr:hypothetical protein [Phycisphaerales bacterium]